MANETPPRLQKKLLMMSGTWLILLNMFKKVAMRRGVQLHTWFSICSYEQTAIASFISVAKRTFLPENSIRSISLDMKSFCFNYTKNARVLFSWLGYTAPTDPQCPIQRKSLRVAKTQMFISGSICIIRGTRSNAIACLIQEILKDYPPWTTFRWPCQSGWARQPRKH